MVEVSENKHVKELLAQLSVLRKEVSNMRKNITNISVRKEVLFKEKSKVSNEIVSCIQEMRKVRSERNKYTQQVKELKKQRSLQAEKIKELLPNLKNLLKERDKLQKKFGYKHDFVKLKKQIKEMEFRIETEGMSFDKEKKLMLKINEKKKQLNESKFFSDISSEIHETHKKIKKLRRKTDDFHRELEKKAEKSQTNHESFMELRRKIDSLRIEEKKRFSKFKEEKDIHIKHNKELKVLLAEMNTISEQLKKYKTDSQVQTKKQEKKTLEEKTKKVNEKIKTRKKLTTEDFLVFQNSLHTSKLDKKQKKTSESAKKKTTKKIDKKKDKEKK